ncbi:MAG: hypothetical protein AAB133_04305 [Pseudomonadota bacterium]
MKTWPKAIGTFVLVLIATLASGSAMAQHHRHGHGGNLRFGISIGVPLFALGYYRAPYYAYPAYAYPAPVYAYPSAIMGSAPPVYIEQGTAQQAPAQALRDWYYCAASNAYYPQVGECPAGWQRVPAQPPTR